MKNNYKEKYRKEIELIERLFKPIKPKDFKDLVGKAIYDIDFNFDNQQVEFTQYNNLKKIDGKGVSGYLQNTLNDCIHGKFYFVGSDNFDLEERCRKSGFFCFPYPIVDDPCASISVEDLFVLFEPELVKEKFEAF